MNEKNTIQIRIDRKLHKQFKHEAINQGVTLTELASKIIKHYLDNNFDTENEIDTIKI